MVQAVDNNTMSLEAPPAAPAGGIPIVGRTRGPFSYWVLASSAISTQYIFEALDAIIKPTNKILAFLKTKNIEPRAGSALHFAVSNIYAFTVGMLMVGITTLFGVKTYRDMQSMFAEAVGNELGKPKEQVGLFDLLKSKNILVKDTMKTFLVRNSIREALSLMFFLPWNIFNKDKKGLDNVAVKGARGLLGGYLISDTLFRKETLFEFIQRTVDEKINHNGDNPDSSLSYRDIMAWLERYKRSRNKSYHQPALNTPEWQQEKLLATRIASLMNQAYGNIPNVEQSRFTFTTLIELMGNRLLDRFPESLGYVELANRSKDMRSVKKAADFIRNGGNPEHVFPEIYNTFEKAEMTATETSQNERTQNGIRQILAGGAPNCYRERVESLVQLEQEKLKPAEISASR